MDQNSTVEQAADSTAPRAKIIIGQLWITVFISFYLTILHDRLALSFQQLTNTALVCAQKGRERMKKLFLAAVAAVVVCTSAYADTIKVGVIGPFSGPFALQGKDFKAGIDAYMAVNGNTVGSDTVEIRWSS